MAKKKLNEKQEQESIQENLEPLSDEWLFKLIGMKGLSRIMARLRDSHDAFEVLYKVTDSQTIAKLLKELSSARSELEGKTRLLNEEHERRERVKKAIKECKDMKVLREKLKEKGMLFN